MNEHPAKDIQPEDVHWFDEVFELLDRPMTKTEWLNKCKKELGERIPLITFSAVVDYLVKNHYVDFEEVTTNIGDGKGSIKSIVHRYYPLI
jgi:hypothetical protein